MSGLDPASGDGGTAAEPGHIPVLLTEVLAALAPVAGARLVDGTYGAGGYTGALLRSAADVAVMAIERDPYALAQGQAHVARASGSLRLVEGCFGDMADLAEEHGFAPVDGVVLDIGVSSMQLDTVERGFSFQGDGPLDMRMGQSGETAADVVNSASESQLADILFHLGEERQSRRIARQIVRARDTAPIERTSQLAALVERTIGRRPQDDRHPATRTFQALRIWVNDELGELARGLAGAERILKPGGRLAVVTFHSLEDRIVKRFLTRRSGRTDHGSRHAPPQQDAHGPGPSFHLLNQKPITPGDAEIDANPRARSAKLRVGVRTEAPAWPVELPEVLGLPIIGDGARR
ncbi:MAG: 16S rRNA (cytosine(1402)-N(4))-methyltransferase RsmH [Hyphomicrobiaceae bacterium]